MLFQEKLDSLVGCNGKFLFIAFQMVLILKPTSTRLTHGFVEGPSTQPNHDAVEGLFGRVKSRNLGAEIAKQKKKKEKPKNLCIVSKKKAAAKHMFSDPSGLEQASCLVSQQCFFHSSTCFVISFT